MLSCDELIDTKSNGLDNTYSGTDPNTSMSSTMMIAYNANGATSEIARQLGCSKSGVNDFLKAFSKSERISFPLPEGITNEKISELVYGHLPQIIGGRDESFKLPDFEYISQQMKDRENMTLVYQWNRYSRICESEGNKPYQYR